MSCCDSVRGSDCHCGTCHQTFSSLKLFDRHQDVDYDRTPMVMCAVPAELGLVQDYRGTWAMPEAAASRSRSAEAMAARNQRLREAAFMAGGSSMLGDAA